MRIAKNSFPVKIFDSAEIMLLLVLADRLDVIYIIILLFILWLCIYSFHLHTNIIKVINI